MSFPKIRHAILFGLFGLIAGVFAQTPDNLRESASSGAAVVASTMSMDVLDAERKLGKGDRLSYRVVEERRPPIALVIAASGEVELPLIGRIQAAGRTCRELAYAIKAPLEREYFYKATVIIGLDAVSERAVGRIYLSGQVRTQGAMDIPPDERFTVSKAILKAGGLADFANSRKIKLVRKGAGGVSETQFIDLDEITKKGRLEKDVELQPDDVIIVPEKFVNF